MKAFISDLNQVNLQDCSDQLANGLSATISYYYSIATIAQMCRFVPATIHFYSATHCEEQSSATCHPS